MGQHSSQQLKLASRVVVSLGIVTVAGVTAASENAISPLLEALITRSGLHPLQGTRITRNSYGCFRRAVPAPSAPA
jgi:hypothetical protein